MNATRKTLSAIVAALSLGLALAPAQAQPAGRGMGPCGQGANAAPCMGPGMGPGRMGGPGNCMGPGMGPGMGRGGMGAANIDARLADLRAQLVIAPNQEAAWQAYAGKVKAQAERMQTMRQARPGASMTPAQRQTFREAMMKQHAAERADIAQAAQTLHAVLEPPQKAIFDASCPGAMAGPGMRGPVR